MKVRLISPFQDAEQIWIGLDEPGMRRKVFRFVSPDTFECHWNLAGIEADTGKVLHADRATTPWYPASITKIMTAYLVFEALKWAKRLKVQARGVSTRAPSRTVRRSSRRT